MAEEKILYRIVVDGQNATAKIINLTNGFEKADVAVENLNQTLGEMNGEMVRTTSGIGRQMASLKKQRSQVQINSKEYQNLTKSMRFYQSQMDMSTGATGSASSAAMELGRVMSDAPYGIRGVANNVSQFASQMAFAAKSTGSLTLAFKDLWKALMGPLGILLAIQGAIALLDFYKGGMSKSKDETVDAEKATKDFSSELKSLEKTLSDSGVSQENYNQKIRDYILLKKQQIALDKELLSTQSEIDKKNEEINATTEDDIKLNERLEKARKNAADQATRIYPDTKEGRQAKTQAKDYSITIEEIESRLRNNISHRKKLEEDIVQLHADALKKIKEIDDAKNKLGAAEEGTLQALKNQRKELEKTRELEAKTPEEYKKQSIAIDKITKQIEHIEGIKNKSIDKSKRDKATLLFDTEGLKKESLKYVKELMKVDEKIALLSAKDKKSRLIIQRDFHLKRLIATHGANSELVKAYKKYYRQLIQTAEEGELELLAKEGAKGMGGAPRNTTTDAEAIKDRQRLLTQVKLEALMQSSQAISGFMDSEFQRDITMEQNKTNAINNELRERLNNENLSAGERKRIQLKIARNDEVLRKKQEIIEKKRFKLQKAANISQALISTYLAVAQVQANPLDLNPVTKGISMAATLAVGLANVATLARQKFQSSAGATSTAGALGGGSGRGGEGREFNFNLAGSTQSNQLTQSIAGQLSQPIQAYVVSSEMTSQQQLDLSISNTATIG